MKLIIEIEGEFEGLSPELNEDLALKFAAQFIRGFGMILSEDIDYTENWAFDIGHWTARWDESE